MEPKLIPADTLAAKAVQDCVELVESILEGEYFAEPAPGAKVEWDDTVLRYTFTQHATVWRRVCDFEVIVDPDLRVVGFVDHDKWEGCKYEPLGERAALDLVRATDLVHGSPTVVRMGEGERGCQELLLKSGSGSSATGLRVQINPARRAVISVQPVPLPEQE